MDNYGLFSRSVHMVNHFWRVLKMAQLQAKTHVPSRAWGSTATVDPKEATQWLSRGHLLLRSFHGTLWYTYKKLWKITILRGKSTISMAIFKSKLLVYQRVNVRETNGKSLHFGMGKKLSALPAAFRNILRLWPGCVSVSCVTFEG